MIRQPPAKRKTAKTLNPHDQSLEDKVAQLAGQLEVLKAQVHQAQQLASLGTAAAMMAHEVNNLLTPILAYAESALQSNDVELAKKALTVTARNSRMLISMSGRMLELGAAKVHEREKVDVQQAVIEAQASMCRDLDKDGITFSTNIEDGLAVMADPLQLRQIFFNLFLNAQEAMAPTHSGMLTVRARRDGANVTRTDGRALIEVRNTGPMIASELLPYIFEPFQSSKTGTRNGKVRCSGMGLALVRDLVRENGGTIEVSSTEQWGTAFQISLQSA